ncbi:hypothetical protein E2542_SST08656 [Spatholobus suberectus]|nr:hypothetical protein E2542_SST08656 [Spatholobus suberectus]
MFGKVKYVYPGNKLGGLSGKIQCALFGKYVDTLKEFLAASDNELPTFVLQFAKVKTYKGQTVVQNVMNTFRLFWNPQTVDALEVKNRLIGNGFEVNVPLGVIEDSKRFVPLKEEFLKQYPRKTIFQLHAAEEDGFFIVLGTIVSVLNDDQWWYVACKCHKMKFSIGFSKLEGDDSFDIKLEVTIEDFVHLGDDDLLNISNGNGDVVLKVYNKGEVDRISVNEVEEGWFGGWKKRERRTEQKRPQKVETRDQLEGGVEEKLENSRYNLQPRVTMSIRHACREPQNPPIERPPSHHREPSHRATSSTQPPLRISPSRRRGQRTRRPPFPCRPLRSVAVIPPDVTIWPPFSPWLHKPRSLCTHIASYVSPSRHRYVVKTEARAFPVFLLFVIHSDQGRENKKGPPPFLVFAAQLNDEAS